MSELDWEIINRLVRDKEAAKHPCLKKVPEGKEFLLKCFEDCVIAEVTGLDDLYKTLKEAPPEVIAFHINEKKNDFATWVREIVGDLRLAEELEQIKVFRPDKEELEKVREELLKTLDLRIKLLRLSSINLIF